MKMAAETLQQIQFILWITANQYALTEYIHKHMQYYKNFSEVHMNYL